MDSPEALQMEDGAPDPSSTSQLDVERDDASQETSVPRARQPRHRGRQAKDPLGQSIFIKCQRAEDLETKLREYLAEPTGDPEHTTLEFSFPVTAAFMVSAREPIGPQLPDRKVPYLYSSFNKTAISVIDALHTIKDPKEQMLMQRKISKSLVESVQEADGFRYSFHNHWVSREDQGSRFSYYCNDSTLNKGRAANEGASKIRDGVKVRKEVFDCHGLISIKFSVTKMTLELHYKHVPLHKTYEERAPPPRKDSKRRKLLEIFHPDKIPKPKEKKRKATPPPKPPSKRKRRATEPVPQVDSASFPQAARENSLQPLFDFLGSASRLEEERPGATGSDTPGDALGGDPEPAQTAVGEDGSDQPGELTASGTPIQRRQRKVKFPGMMSGFMLGDEITWGKKSDARAARAGQRLKENAPATQADRQAPGPPIQASTENLSNPPTELELLKARLQDAERKIQEMEAEKQRAAAPMRYSGPPQFPATPPNPGYPHPYYPPPPPPPHYPYPPPQWQYPPPPPPHPRHPHGPPLTPHSNMHSVPPPGFGPSPAPAQFNTPLSAPPSQPLPTPPSVPQAPPAHGRTPAYGFVPHPVAIAGPPVQPPQQPQTTAQPPSASPPEQTPASPSTSRE